MSDEMKELEAYAMSLPQSVRDQVAKESVAQAFANLEGYVKTSNAPQNPTSPADKSRK